MDSNTDKQLIIFHIDLNFVNLREDYLRKWLGKIAAMGYNAILWELEDKVSWEMCPECVFPEAISKEKFSSILNYSRELGLEPIPLFQTIGHAEYVLTHEVYRSFRELPERQDCYCTSNSDVRKFIKKWIDEYLDLFGDLRFFHIGGDEAYVFCSCPICSAEAEKSGRNAVYGEYIMDIVEPILKRGVRPGIWDDMILHHSDVISAIPKEFIMWDWHYSYTELDDKPAYPDVDMLKQEGYEVITCSASRSHGDNPFCGGFDHHAGNIVAAARKTITSKLLGTCVTSWAIRLNDFENQEPTILLAPLTMQFPDASYTELLEQCSERLFDIPADKLFPVFEQISQSRAFAKYNLTSVQWNGMKDFEPTPENHISKLLKKWQTEQTGVNSWDNRKQTITQGLQYLPTATEKLYEFVTDSSKGAEILSAWTQAAYFQLWFTKIIQTAFKKSEGIEDSDKSEFIVLTKKLKQKYNESLRRWVTPQSADQCTAKVFDSLIEFIDIKGSRKNKLESFAKLSR